MRRYSKEISGKLQGIFTILKGRLRNVKNSINERKNDQESHHIKIIEIKKVFDPLDS